MLILVCGLCFVCYQVNGEVWDLDRPLEGNCSLSVLKFDDDDGKYNGLC